MNLHVEKPTKAIAGIVCLMICFLLAACATVPPPPPPLPQEFRPRARLTLEQGVTLLGQNLKTQLEPPAPKVEETFSQKLLRGGKAAEQPAPTTKLMLYDPIIFVQSGQQLKVNLRIVSILRHQLGADYDIQELEESKLPQAQYVLTGALAQHADAKAGDNQPGYDLVISVIEVGAWRVVAKGQIWVDKIPFDAFAIYEDSPIYLLDKSSRLAKEMAGWSIGQSVDPVYLGFLATKGLLQEAINRYEAKDYAQGAELFGKITKQASGRTLTALGGLYLSLQKLGREQEAEQAFEQLLTVAVEENHRLDIKLLFGVNSAAFVPNKELVKLYAWWLRLIATHMEKSNLCLAVVGHSSHTGEANYNVKLSLARAKTVRGQLAKTYPGILKKSVAIGKGFRENIVGTGADDASDALDRRVEFLVVGCDEIPKGGK